MAQDCEKYNILKMKISSYVDMTDYFIRPTVARYFG